MKNSSAPQFPAFYKKHFRKDYLEMKLRKKDHDTEKGLR